MTMRAAISAPSTVSAFARTSATLTPSRTSAPARGRLLQEEVVEALALGHVGERRACAALEPRAVAQAALEPVDHVLDYRLDRERQKARGARRDSSAARLVAREDGLVDEEDARAGGGEPVGGDRAGRPCADDRDVERAHEVKATIPAPGGVPERPKGTGCKPVGSAYGGSNPPAPILTPLIAALAAPAPMGARRRDGVCERRRSRHS